MQADRGTLWLVDSRARRAVRRAAHLPELSQIRLKLGQGVAGHVAKHGEVVNIPDRAGERALLRRTSTS